MLLASRTHEPDADDEAATKLSCGGRGPAGSTSATDSEKVQQNPAWSRQLY
jgi:hypothetical protein